MKKLSFGAILAFVVKRWLGQPAMLAWTLGGVALATVADICTPLLAGRLVGDISTTTSASSAAGGREALLHDALLMVSGLLVLGLVGVMGRRSSYLGISKLSLAVMRRVLDDAFARVQRFSSDWHANNFAGSTVRRITRGIWAIDTLDDTLLLLITPEVLVLLGTTLVLLVRAPLMGLVLAVMVGLFACMSIWLAMRYVAPTARISNACDSRMGAVLGDAITCNAVVKSFGAEEREERQLHAVARTWADKTYYSWYRGTNSANFQASYTLLMRVVMIGLAVLLWWRGMAGPGDVAYVLTMMFLIQGYLRDLGQQVSQVQRSVNEMEELVGLFSSEPAIRDIPGAIPLEVTAGEIVLLDVSFRYPSQEKPIYQGLSLRIAPGSRVALVGASGSGKTTLTRLLQRLYDVDGGNILIDGQDIAYVTQQSLRRQIALVPQEPMLFHRTLAENIAYGRPDATREEIEQAARLANADGFITRLAEGYETLVGERGVKLSGGERQRVAIARAFLVDAPIVIFDEATASLDSESEMLVQEAMTRLMETRTVLVVAHRLATVRDLDRILVFHQGQIVEDGTHESLMALKDGAYRRLVSLQSLDAASP
ncbi:ABC transporter ATP-binding protein [Parasaccharibacter apium]|uniref:Multidrug ABC transporter ATP-binding protein n=1 Tax=Parasaccharibacter apium TaxID=1510841 RepID=A0ABX4ZQ05_9PROT|nr:ABC transporter ATP-binding protein [Parasaccharibacter apium]POS61498.1 multidrug ABC transporter ATP-binding protein [Parasaccharibacter apium]POS64937.1 multidrug ABC transporter ATP-binding protein [Parasaccharibacter apium]POS65416.1 multidrug ABC transporter ATP-binding protein [Parasaccharibacter apium]